MTFLVSEDNGGCCRWTLLGPDGDGLARDDSVAERWLDEGGSVNRDTVTDSQRNTVPVTDSRLISASHDRPGDSRCKANAGYQSETHTHSHSRPNSATRKAWS
jgi:hypothetical protein